MKRRKSVNRKGVEKARRKTHSNAVRVALLEREVAATVLQSEAAALRDSVGTEACKECRKGQSKVEQRVENSETSTKEGKEGETSVPA
jgi:hypothetical protein